ncbi:MAG: type IV toxin-antitoxin system AbiEi family antitoxin domain-containing protein [Propionibacteriaceae bacterium]
MDLALRPVIADNQGFFLRSQALDVGLLDRDLVDGLRAGDIVRLRHGAYAPAADHRDLTPVEQYAVLTRAAVAAQRGRVAVTGPSAAALHGLPLYACDLSVVHLIRLDGGATRCEAGVRHHKFGRDLTADLMELNGIQVTGMARTAWEVARVAGVDAGVVTADGALHRSPEIVTELRAFARLLSNQPGARAAGEVVWLADGRSESPGESVLRVRFVRYGIPKPVLQLEVYDEDGRLIGRTDFGWPEHRHLGEFDGMIKYGRLLREGETSSDVIVREKLREDELRGVGSGYGMSRFIWASTRPRRVDREMARLHHDLGQSRRLYASR